MGVKSFAVLCDQFETKFAVIEDEQLATAVSLAALSCEIGSFVSIAKQLSARLESMSSTGAALAKSVHEVVHTLKEAGGQQVAEQVMDALADATTHAMERFVSTRPVVVQINDALKDASLAAVVAELALSEAIDWLTSDSVDDVQKENRVGPTKSLDKILGRSRSNEKTDSHGEGKEKNAVAKAVCPVLLDFANYVETKLAMLLGKLRGGTITETVGFHYKDYIGMRIAITINMSVVNHRRKSGNEL